MKILRPVAQSDLDPLNELVGTIADGLTTLPNNPDFLERRIHDSIRAFYPRIDKPGGEYYLFVLEDSESKKLIGTSALVSRVGGFDPFYTYEIKKNCLSYERLEIQTELETLHLKRNHKGPTEICSLFLHPDFRKGGMGRLLSLARFCFIRAFPKRFDTHIIAEMRGFIDESGKSPFWEAVGKRFFQKDYYTADILSGLGEKEFIEVLMPKFPIYLNLLPFSAQNVIGRVHTDTEPALKLLLKEGFSKTDEVDIFDAGPLLCANRETLKTWQAAKFAPANSNEPNPSNRSQALITNNKIDFRAIVAPIEEKPDGSVAIGKEAFDALKPESQILYVKFS
jgi:arginine N-succinyltransferase